MTDATFQLRRSSVRAARRTGGLLLLCSATTGCAVSHDMALVDMMARGAYGAARVHTQRVVAQRGGAPADGGIDRQTVLDRMRQIVATLADGYVAGQEQDVVALFDLLRLQGLNHDRTTAAVVFHEGVRLWKGEPFEQAMAFQYVALHYALRNQWGNVRAASDNALFHLRDFGRNAEGHHATTADLARSAHADPDYLDRGYVSVPSDFAPAHLMLAVAALRLGRADEADDHFDHVLRVNANLASTVASLRRGSCDTLLIVEHGLGPAKIATGPDGAIASFFPRTPSDARPLLVDAGNGGAPTAHPVVCDLNRMAAHHRWRNLEDVRMAKSAIGSLLMGAGTGVVIAGSHDDDETAEWIGMGMILAGAAVRAGARADTRYCEILPQRVYFVPLAWPPGRQSVRLQIDGLDATRFDVAGLRTTESDRFKVGYVRLPAVGEGPLAWAASGEVFYASDAAPDATPSRLPYILGGNCVRTPSPQVLAEYRRHGLPGSVSLTDLEALYRLEEIVPLRAGAAPPGRHVLEGGRSLAGPLPGTAGFARLFGRKHRPYQPRSRRVRDLAAHLAGRPAVRTHPEDSP